MGSPLISTLASLCFYITVVTTLIMSCIRGELSWGSLVVAVVMVVISFLEGLFLYLQVIGSWIYSYMQAKLACDTKEMRRCREELKDAASFALELLFMCPLVCVAAVPVDVVGFILESMDSIICVIRAKSLDKGYRKVNCM